MLQKLKNDIANKAFGMTAIQAQEQKVCINCKREVIKGVNLFTKEGEKEYYISGMCEICFDKLFKEGE